MNAREFLEALNQYRIKYFGLEEALLSKENLRASEVTFVKDQQRHIEEKIINFVLYPPELNPIYPEKTDKNHL